MALFFASVAKVPEDMLRIINVQNTWTVSGGAAHRVTISPTLLKFFPTPSRCSLLAEGRRRGDVLCRRPSFFCKGVCHGRADRRTDQAHRRGDQRDSRHFQGTESHRSRGRFGASGDYDCRRADQSCPEGAGRSAGKDNRRDGANRCTTDTTRASESSSHCARRWLNKLRPAGWSGQRGSATHKGLVGCSMAGGARERTSRSTDRSTRPPQREGSK